ncbi:phage tail family protein [Aerococcus tenax]|uniref:phage tail protein n=1 Tax=Aerococcus tenax TaxID=3078812 RepID=UPI00124604FF|nr:phage tail protein [Aerococcus tenax]KAA9298647.1 phage tail protein [Aerococcus tenax]
MIIIDALITKLNDDQFKLSDLGLEVLAVDVSAPSLSVDFREIRNHSGRVKAGSRFDKKEIKVSGYFSCKGLAALDNFIDRLYGALVDEDGYYLTKLTPIEDLYNFEVPGQKTGEVRTSQVKHKAQKYRYHVINVGDIETSFKGLVQNTVTYLFVLRFETIGLPYGETIPKDITVTNSIPYAGTASNSQLESPWVVKLTATQSQKGDFYFTVGDRRFEHKSLTTINKDDVFHLHGVETWLNHRNINEYTNYEHFVLKPTRTNSIPIQTDFKGTIEILNYQEFYK